ncbi:hydrolase [Sulfitobacter sp. BDSS02]|uniref:fumarylacetoacetate hydrolase family protein n=1 Tax=Heliomarina sp. TaxID=2917556 RepID=UPI004057ECF6|nr:hydrolase [Sulfitobacter sp. BDSS02]MBR9848637.1 fumarylacetoacetate hydrolase family protein [Paracoccaceae bacterium]
MKFATFEIQSERRVGLVDPDGSTVRPFDLTLEESAQGVAVLIGRSEMPRQMEPIPLSQVKLCAPIPRPSRNIFCVGKNYHAHAEEFASSGFDSSAANSVVPKDPIIFSKVPETVVGPGAEVRLDPNVSTSIDYEAELGVIIGKGGRGISANEAMGHVWGYTIINDVTARDLQGKYSQWLIGKSQDTFCPMGPWVVTADEVDLDSMRVRCAINGEMRQDASVRDLIFDIPTLIETISAGVSLKPGDVIATGTPEGVGIGFKPPKYLVDGDLIRVEIDQIGYLENPVRAS